VVAFVIVKEDCGLANLCGIMFPNPAFDRACIAGNRRTSSSRTALLNMGKENPRLVDPVSAAYGVCEESTRETVDCPGDLVNGAIVGFSGGGNDVCEAATTTTRGAGHSDHRECGVTGTDSDSSIAGKDSNIIASKRLRDVYIAKRRAQCRARQKKT